MASSFEDSSHRRLLVTRSDLRHAHLIDRKQGLTHAEIRRVKAVLIRYLIDIAKESSLLIRRRVISTAAVYLRRFYLSKNFAEFDPRHVAPACLYLACKAEECQVQAKMVVLITQRLQQIGKYPYIPAIDMKQLLDLELAVLEVLDFNLVIYSAAPAMMHTLQNAELTSLGKAAWSALNDSYLTEAYLLYKPLSIAMGSLVVAGSLADQDVLACFTSMECDIDEVYDAAQELLTLYENDQSNHIGEVGEALRVLNVLHCTVSNC